MTEKLDPEEVKEIMDRIFGKISLIVVKYDGFIEKSMRVDHCIFLPIAIARTYISPFLKFIFSDGSGL